MHSSFFVHTQRYPMIIAKVLEGAFEFINANVKLEVSNNGHGG
jgi:hypothetical protein